MSNIVRSSYLLFSTELPIPTIGDVSELQRECTKLRQQNNNTTMLGLKYHELNEIDSIKVDLVPEKKGVILKHVEYNVTSQVRKISWCTHNPHGSIAHCKNNFFSSAIK